jgi:hypothetical protein
LLTAITTRVITGAPRPQFAPALRQPVVTEPCLLAETTAEDVMSMWNLVEAAGWMAAGFVLLLMAWAARERARLRREWMRLHRELDDKRAPFDWCMATAVAAGCI